MQHYFSKNVRQVRSGGHIVCEAVVNGEWETFATFSEFDDFASSKANKACLMAVNKTSQPITNIDQIWGN